MIVIAIILIMSSFDPLKIPEQPQRVLKCDSNMICDALMDKYHDSIEVNCTSTSHFHTSCAVKLHQFPLPVRAASLSVLAFVFMLICLLLIALLLVAYDDISKLKRAASVRDDEKIILSS